ncbi:MAG TPA: rhodanese-like domain-containing protein [Verrucomicrobiae bacterium]|jgi:rhodanese-related sulfurtransferase|nr:rhodanese-like domain-containing protein [Verrucomicrobiae bacterium]
MNTTLTVPDPVKARDYFENKLSFTIGPVELDHMLKAHENINLIDVRAEEDYRKGHIPGAINLPRDKWDTLEGLSKEKSNIVYCYSMVCHLAATAAHEFASKGYPMMELEGGFDEWKEHGLEVEKNSGSRMFNFGH